MATTEAKAFVQERLELVEMITAKVRPILRDPSLTIDLPPSGWSHPWLYFDALRTYLLLTCFDVLGQPDGFVDFGRWLEGSATKVERDAALHAAKTASGDLLDQIRSVHQQYVEKYGVRRSFYRFIDQVLPTAVRKELLYSVKIWNIGKDGQELVDDKKKEEFSTTSAIVSPIPRKALVHRLEVYSRLGHLRPGSTQ